MTAREINQEILRNRPVVATYSLEGIQHFGRIIQARTRQGRLEGKVLGLGRWAQLTHDVRVTK